MPKTKMDRRVLLFLLGAALGAAAFLLVYGISPLDIRNDAFCRGGFLEKDIQQHYAGWLFYRQSALPFPLCITPAILSLIHISLTRDTLQGALLQEQLVNYFEFADALADVERQQLVSLDEDERYSITDKGSTVADTLAFDLPRTVRESAIRAVMQIQSWKHKAAMNRARIEEEDGEYVVWCAIGDMGSDVFRLQLAMPDKLTAETIRNNFTAHGSEIYSKVMDMLTQPSTEEDRPPACLLYTSRCV